jgi:dTDP-4-amino-4,6-dideoxygalactose transaminase
MPNLNAALLVAQLENLESFLADKRALAKEYREFFKSFDDVEFIEEPQNAKSNYWLNVVSVERRDELLKMLNENGIMSRPVWKLLSDLEIYKECQSDALENSRYLESRLVNIPSGVRL